MNCDFEKTVEKNLPLVRAVAARFKGRGIEFDELCQVGTLGLMKALQGYDEGRGASLSSYAFKFIEGEIRKFIRKNSVVSVSRATMNLALCVTNCIDNSIKKYGEGIEINEIAKALNVSPCEVAHALSLTKKSISINSIIDDEERELELKSDISYDEIAINRAEISKCLDKLSETERKVIILRYLKDFTQIKTGRVLSLSQSQISKHEKNALEKMKKFLENE